MRTKMLTQPAQLKRKFLSFIPGTVTYIGYGTAFEKLEWDGQEYIKSNRFMETKRGFFFKVSYLWRF